MQNYANIKPKNHDCLPAICEGAGCLASPIPGKTFCRRCSGIQVEKVRSAEVMAHRALIKAVEIAKTRAAKDILVENGKTFIYAIGYGQAIKFGRSLDVQKRLEALQLGSPVILEIFAFVKCHPFMETSIHRHLIDVRMHGEWFRRCDKSEQVLNLMHEERVADLHVLVGMKPITDF